jgi:hypothetical protein
MKLNISVNPRTIARNAKYGEDNPPIIVHGPKGFRLESRTVFIDGPCSIVYRPKHKKHGASYYIVTDAPVRTED